MTSPTRSLAVAATSRDGSMPLISRAWARTNSRNSPVLAPTTRYDLSSNDVQFCMTRRTALKLLAFVGEDEPVHSLVGIGIPFYHRDELVVFVFGVLQVQPASIAAINIAVTHILRKIGEVGSIHIAWVNE